VRAEPAAELSARGGFRIQQLWLPVASTLSLKQLARLQREGHGPSAALRECKAYANRVESPGLTPDAPVTGLDTVNEQDATG
jgi:hypothetical protein